jgi:hypothetical protein
LRSGTVDGEFQFGGQYLRRSFERFLAEFSFEKWVDCAAGICNVDQKTWQSKPGFQPTDQTFE